MNGNFIDHIRCSLKNRPQNWEPDIRLINTSFGVVRVKDTGGDKPVIMNVPDGPNVIEHHYDLIDQLSKNFRVICFEFPGIGFSYPNSKFDYSLDKASSLIINLLDILEIDRTTLAFSCSNGFYAIRAAQSFPERFNRLILTQTPSMHAMKEWTKGAIPKLLNYPLIGQFVNSFSEKKFASIWYRYALPKSTGKEEYRNTAIEALNSGGCFCLSGLVQGLAKEIDKTLYIHDTPTTMIWGAKDFTHKHTDKNSILQHIPKCAIIQFDDCGHFPELEQTKKYVQIVNDILL